MSWLAASQELIATDLPQERHREATENVVSLIRASSTRIVDVVKGLSSILTSTEDPKRARGLALLAEVVDAVPEACRTEGNMHHLAEFFTARLTDWPAVQGALQGCLALLSRPSSSSSSSSQLPALASQDAVVMMRACTEHVFVRSLAQQGRRLALDLLHQAVLNHGQALLDGNVDLLEWSISALDGEKDPRCLLAAFAALRELLALYACQPEHSVHQARLEEAADELFDVVACYFPIAFTPPPDDPHGITRQQLAQELEPTLVACPLFAQHLLPLLMEKLSSSLRQAKVDALSALGASAETFPPEVLNSHISAIGAALRAELLAPAAGALLEAELKAAEEMAEAAAACLARCLAALQLQPSGSASSAESSSALADAVLSDASLADLESCVRSPGTDNAAAFRRSVLRVSALSRVLAALAKAGGAAGRRAAAQVPKLLSATEAATDEDRLASTCLAWAVIVTVLRAAAALSALDPSLVQQVAAAAAAGASHEQSYCADGGTKTEQAQLREVWSTSAEAYTGQRAAWLQLSALEALGKAPQLAAALETQQTAAALAAALPYITGPGSDGQHPLCQQATAVLCALACSSHAGVVGQHALPALLAASTAAAASSGPLTALQALASASSELQAEVVIALDGAIQTSLSAVDASPASSGLAMRLLQAASGILLSAEPSPRAQQQAGQLALHLLDAVALLPPSGLAAALLDGGLVTAAGEAAFYATRAADPGSQGRLAAAAAEALQQAATPGLQLAVCSAALVPADPSALSAALPSEECMSAVRRLVTAATSAGVCPEAAKFAAVGAAGLLNKAAGDAAMLTECVEATVDRQLLPLALSPQSSNGLNSRAAAWHALAAVAQGLAMRGHPHADAITSGVLSHMEALATAVPAAGTEGADRHETEQQQVEAAQAAARYFCMVLSVDSSPAAVALNKHSQAVARPLWQQRLYTRASTQVLSMLQASLRSGEGAQGTAEQQSAPPVLLLAVGQLLRGAPASVVASDLTRMLPWVLQCLAVLQQRPWADAGLLHFLLQLVASFLETEAGKREAEVELSRLVPVLLGLALWPPAAAVRDAALKGLLALAEQLPYTSLHPYSRQVGKAAAAACDDPKRAVRLQAARVRQAWNS